MQFRINGADRYTAKDVEIVLEARDGLEAERLANERNVMVSSVTALPFRVLFEPFSEFRNSSAMGFKQLVKLTPHTSLIEGWWCDRPVKLLSKVQTPFGSKVTVVSVCVDVLYSVQERTIILRYLALSRSPSIGPFTTNVASPRTGEAWQACQICSQAQLAEVVRKELLSEGSRLRKLMLGKWYGEHHDVFAKDLTDTLNAGGTPEQIAAIIRLARRGIRLTFIYTKELGQSEKRRVIVQGVSGSMLRAKDMKDGQIKSFRLDRITDVER